MAVSWKQLASGVAIGTASTMVVTAPSQTQVQFDAASVYNSAGSAVNVQLYLLPSGGSPSTAALITSKNVPSLGSLFLADVVNHKLEPGGILYAIAGATGCTVNVSGKWYVPQ